MKEDYEKNIRNAIKSAIEEDPDSLSFFDDMVKTEFPIPDGFWKKKEPCKKKARRPLKTASLILAFFCCSILIAVYLAEHGTVHAIKVRFEQLLWNFSDDLSAI